MENGKHSPESRRVLMKSGQISLAEMWCLHRGDASGKSYTADDMLAILDRPDEDPERREMLDWVPGTEEELRERLTRPLRRPHRR